MKRIILLVGAMLVGSVLFAQNAAAQDPGWKQGKIRYINHSSSRSFRVRLDNTEVGDDCGGANTVTVFWPRSTDAEAERRYVERALRLLTDAMNNSSTVSLYVREHFNSSGNRFCYVSNIQVWAPPEQTTSGGNVVDLADAAPIRDFPMTIPRNCSRQVRICVRDYSCEDGDEVRVTVNGATVFEGELFHRSQCRTVAVREGNNSIRLVALNGTGFKGSCQHTDVNTGELTITSPGGAQESQRWRHRGGAGSSANMTVTVGAATGSCAFG